MKVGGILRTVLLLVIANVFFGVPVFASSTNGTIDSESKYAWGSKIGWINFGASNGSIHITDTVLTGYAWNEIYGWINLNPANGGVTNDGAGNLSGYAWGDQLGWVNFSGVTIGSSGRFSGQASGDNIGVLNFSCTNCAVQTDWRPSASRPPENNGGIGLPSGAVSDPVANTLSVVVNNGLPEANTSTVNIWLRVGTDISYAWVAEDGNYVNNLVRYYFDAGVTERNVVYLISKTPGQKSIYVKFCTQWGQCSDSFTNSINYVPVVAPVIITTTTPEIKPEKPTKIITASKPLSMLITAPVKEGIKYFENLFSQVSNSLQKSFVSRFNVFTPNNLANLFSQTSVGQNLAVAFPGITQFFANTAGGISKFFGFESVQQPVNIERLVSVQAPLAMSGKINIMPAQSVNRFVFAPLPKEFLALQKQFPDIKKTFSQIGVNRMGDLQKLQSAQMYLPGLSQVVGVTSTQLGVTQYGVGPSLPVGQLPANLKSKIPTDVVFARVGNQLVDSKVALSLTASGKPEQKITTISGKTMFLTVRPDKPVTRVRGFVVFRSRTPSARAELPLGEMIASVIFAQPAFAYSNPIPVPAEEKLVLQEFEYTDPDGDGLYTANIESPIPVGEYEIITVMDYEDPDLGTKQIRLITVVDPEGYVFENIDGKELRIPGAIATLYYFNADNKQYEEWPAQDYQQENPQVTDVRGTYSFLVPGGMYYLKITAPGYEDYIGKPFPVTEGGGVHMNIELKTNFWWMKLIDWRTALLVLVIILLGYNFYKDKKREK